MKKYALAALAAAATIGIAAPASAVEVIPVTPSTFTAPGQGGGFVALSFAPTYTDGVFQFTFDLTTALRTFTQMQVNGTEVVPYSLFRVGNPVALTSASTPSGFTSILSAGSYYLETTLAPPPGNSFDVISGAVVTSAVPEPATWATMILGFFGLGAVLRRSRRRDALATA